MVNKKKINRYINDELEIFSDDSKVSDEENSDG